MKQMDCTNCDINKKAIENHYIDFMQKVRVTNAYATVYRENSLRKRSIINTVLGILPVALIALISLKKEWLDVLLVLASASTVLEAIAKYLPYEKRAEELLMLISKTDAIVVKLEYVWIQYKHKNHDIDWLVEQQKDLSNDYTKAINRNLPQVTYPLNKRMEKIALEKAEAEMLNLLKNDEGD
jgi:hypothetical protein